MLRSARAARSTWHAPSNSPQGEQGRALRARRAAAAPGPRIETSLTVCHPVAHRVRAWFKVLVPREAPGTQQATPCKASSIETSLMVCHPFAQRVRAGFKVPVQREAPDTFQATPCKASKGAPCAPAAPGARIETSLMVCHPVAQRVRAWFKVQVPREAPDTFQATPCKASKGALCAPAAQPPRVGGSLLACQSAAQRERVRISVQLLLTSQTPVFVTQRIIRAGHLGPQPRGAPLGAPLAGLVEEQVLVDGIRE